MNFNMIIPGLKDVVIKNVVESGEFIQIFVEMEQKVHRCPSCGERTSKVHDYRTQKIHHLKWFER
jgi:transposase